jgi:hypothetical protein
VHHGRANRRALRILVLVADMMMIAISIIIALLIVITA